MRTLISRSLAGLLAMTLPMLASCNGPSIDFWFEKDLAVKYDLPTNPDGTPAAPPEYLAMLDDAAKEGKKDRIPVDLSQFAEFKDKFSQVKEIVVPEIWLEVTELNAEKTNSKTITGKLQFSEVYLGDDATPEQVAAAPKTTLAECSVAKNSALEIAKGAKMQLVFDPEPQRKFEQLARSTGKFTMFYEVAVQKKDGAPSPLPVDFKVKARVHILATVAL